MELEDSKIVIQQNDLDMTLNENRVKDYEAMIQNSNHKELKRNHVCSLCGNTYKYSSILSSHVKRIHNDEKDFTCNICEKQFFGKRRLLKYAHKKCPCNIQKTHM